MFSTDFELGSKEIACSLGMHLCVRICDDSRWRHRKPQPSHILYIALLFLVFLVSLSLSFFPYSIKLLHHFQCLTKKSPTIIQHLVSIVWVQYVNNNSPYCDRKIHVCELIKHTVNLVSVLLTSSWIIQRVIIRKRNKVVTVLTQQNFTYYMWNMRDMLREFRMTIGLVFGVSGSSWCINGKVSLDPDCTGFVKKFNSLNV